MNNTIHYLNTDLDLTSSDDLTRLAKVFEAKGASPLHVARSDDGLWRATIETDVHHHDPEPNIAEMLAIIESLPDPLQTDWRRCTQLEFNIGYDCGTEPWAFNQGLSNVLLRRIAAVGASLRITLYPNREDVLSDD